jgi:nitrate reductase beta subunit
MYNRIEPNKLYIPENQRYYKPSPFTYNLFPSLTKKGSLKLTKQSQTNNGKNVFFIKENTSLNLQHVKPFNFESNSLNSKSNSPNTAINSPSNSLNSKSNFLKLSKSKETIV